MWNTAAVFIVHQWSFNHLVNESGNSILNRYDINTTRYYFPNEIWEVKPVWEIVVKVLTIIPIVFLGILGNGSLIYVIICTRSLKTTTNLLVANMALADLGTLLICPWMLLCNDLFQNYIFGAIGCHVEGFITNALTLVAVFSLSAVSYDRVSAIVLSYSGKLSQRTAYAIICMTWFAGLAVAAPLALFRNYQTRQWIDFVELYCTEDSVHLASYWNIFVGISVWAPLAIMAVCYTVILIKLDKYETLALKSKHPIAVKYKGKVATTLALVVAVFILCRVPFTIFVLQRQKLLQEIATQQWAATIHRLWYASRYLVLLNAAVDPVLYGLTSSSLRQALFSCPTLAWILRNRKIKCVPRCNVNWQSMPNKCGNLIPRSPYFCPDNQQEPLPNISSKLKPLNYNISPIF